MSTGELLRTLSGHDSSVYSVSFSPDAKRLASGSSDKTVKIWDAASMTIKLSLTPLPGNEWISYHPEKWIYNSSLQGDEYAAIRFDNRLRPVYPLEYYRSILKKTDLSEALRLPQPEIKPKRFRLWWDRAEGKWLWFGGFMFVAITASAVTLILRRRSDPMVIGRAFFAIAGFKKVESLADDILLLHPEEGMTTGLATLFTNDGPEELEKISTITLGHKQRIKAEIKLYVIYKNSIPSSNTIQSIRKAVGGETIPILSTILERALQTGNCEEKLKELEEPYLVRIDPYLESKPINDPTWFYGRDELLNRMPAILAQGQHIGIFGLRKVGKTSLVNQLQQHLTGIPSVFIDCQAFTAEAEVYFDEIIRQLHKELQAYGMKGLPNLRKLENITDFRKKFLLLFDLWEKSGKRVSFLIIMDEIDKFFPNREAKDSEVTLSEYVQFFRIIRGLAQTRKCLVTMAVAYRPDVNRHNQLTSTVGENPMFKSYQEEYVGFLSHADSEKMICEIGLWKKIEWGMDAAQRVFYYCGGHPLITRIFASHTCKEGNLKSIDYQCVEDTAEEIKTTLRKNDIGNYYKEGVWNILRKEEQEVLMLICKNGSEGMSEREIPSDMEEALTNMEQFGLVSNADNKLRLTAQLFEAWLERRHI